MVALAPRDPLSQDVISRKYPGLHSQESRLGIFLGIRLGIFLGNSWEIPGNSWEILGMRILGMGILGMESWNPVN